MISNLVTDDEIVNEIKCAKSAVDNLHYSSETENESDSDYSEYNNGSRIEGFNALKAGA